MWINGIKVTGDYGFEYAFERNNILLGKNGSGKTTFTKLILYALGAKINDFIDEIAKYEYCDYVYLDIETKSKNRFLITRKLPYVDSVTVIPYDPKAMTFVSEEVQIYNLSEYSDFLLEEENYSKISIQYGASQTATLTYRFLFRTALVDQVTPHYRILANITGDRNDFLNSQELLSVAIIEKILDALSNDLQRLKLQLRDKTKESAVISEKISFYKDVRDTFELNQDSSLKKLERIQVALTEIANEKRDLQKFKYDQFAQLEQSNDKETERLLSVLRKQMNTSKLNLSKLAFEKSDLDGMLKSFKLELDDIKKQLSAQKVLHSIPVTICPVCFSPLDGIPSEGMCPHCKDNSQQEILDSIASYKRIIEDTIRELDILLSQNILSTNQEKKTNRDLMLQLSSIESDYLAKRDAVETSISSIVEEIQKRVEFLIAKENKLLESKMTLQKLDELKKQKDSLLVQIKDIREDIAEAEKKSTQELAVFNKFEEVYRDVFLTIFGEDHAIGISSETYMPIIDGNEIARSGHSESIKVVAHLSYIWTLFILNKYLEGIRINNIGILILDSPRDKDLDLDKYERFLRMIFEQEQGQVFLTGSILDIETYRKVFGEAFLDTLDESSKLLKPLSK